MNPTVLRRIQLTLLLVGVVVTAMSLAMVAAAYRNDGEIEANKATAMADVVAAERLHAAVAFQTQDGQFHSPRLGLLYPTELAEGQRINVEYSVDNPDIARPAGRSAALAIAPAASVVVIGWGVVGALMVGVAEVNRRMVNRRDDADDLEDAEVDADTASS